MTRSAFRTVDFNAILRVSNILIFCATLAMFAEFGANRFIDGWTVVLAAFLAVQTHIALALERRRRDPFMLVLAFIIIFYYSLRLFTLLVLPISGDLTHYPFQPADSNFALTFILIANTCLYLGLLSARGPSPLSVDAGDWRHRSPLRVALLVAAAIVMVYSRGRLWTDASFPRLLLPLQMFISQTFIIAMALAYCGVYRDTLSQRMKYGLLALIVVEILLHTLAGSRSAIVYFAQTIMLVWLAVAGSIRLRRRTVILATILAPVLVGALLWSFLVGTYTRGRMQSGESSFSFRDSLEYVRDLRSEMTQDKVSEEGLPVVFMRAGFFDFAADRIVHRDRYADIVNPRAYYRSIVDNLLTPGFDVYDQPRISNALIFAYSSMGPPTKVPLLQGTWYSSDQLCLYGELYILFGYLSLPLFFAIGYGFKRTYWGLRQDQPLRLAIWRVVVLSIFVSLINSFGIDWVLGDLVQMVVACTIYRYFFAERGPRDSFGRGARRAPSALAVSAS